MISKRPTGAITSRNAASIGPTLGASLWAGSTIEKSGGGAANIASLATPSGRLRPHYEAALWGDMGAFATAPPPSLGGLLLISRLLNRLCCRLCFVDFTLSTWRTPSVMERSGIGLTLTSWDHHDRAGRHRRTRRVP